jgi:NADH-quinone oxidoreductase subunit A
MLEDYSWVALFLIVGIVFVAGGFITNWFVRPSVPSEQKSSTYECGEVPIGTSWIQFNVRYYLFALIFVIFDVEVVFLFPWAVVFKQLGLFAFVEMMIFIAILIIGLIYAWRKGILKWA